MPAESRVFGFMLLISFVASAADQPPTPPPPDMDLIEFLGSIKTDSSSGKDVLNAIDTGLLPDLPEKTPHENK